MKEKDQLKDATIEELERRLESLVKEKDQLKAATIEELERRLEYLMKERDQLKDATIEELERRVEYLEAITRKDSESILILLFKHRALLTLCPN
jgi:predicted RecB family endonuclease